MFKKRYSLPTLIVCLLLAVLFTFQVTFVTTKQYYKEQINKIHLQTNEDAEKMALVADLLHAYCIYDVTDPLKTDAALSAYIAYCGDRWAYYYSAEAFAARGTDEELYAQCPEGDLREYVVRLVRGVDEHGAELDGYIAKYAKGWKFSRIDRVAAAIMRVTMFEILYMPDIPNKVAINEAVEIAKKYLDEDVVKFVNGILGSFVREEFPEE